MATRVYFPLTEAAPVTPPSAGAEWEHNNGVTRKLLLTADSSTLTTTAYAPDAADHLVDNDSLHRQYVSDPLAAQTLSGNVKAQFQCLEELNNCNLFLTLKITVCSNDGSTTRATLLSITRDTTNELGTTLANRNFPSTALSSYACTAGDRLVVEVGLGGNITSGTGGTVGHNGSIRWGCSASSGDLPEDDTQTGTTYRPWLEFSNNFVFNTYITPTAGAVAATGNTSLASIGSFITTAAGALAAVGLAATVFAGTVTPITPQAGALYFGIAADPNTTITPSAGSMTFTGEAPQIINPVLVTPSVGSLALTGSAGSLVEDTRLTPVVGALALTGDTATLLTDARLTPSVGSLALTGQVSTLRTDFFLTPAAGSLALTGQSSTLLTDQRTTPSVGSLTLSGNSSALDAGLIPTAGALAFTGDAPTVQESGSSNSNITPTAGGLTLTGGSSPQAWTATPAVGALAITGATSNLIVDTQLTPAAGSLAFTGNTATTITDSRLTPVVGALAFTGYSATQGLTASPVAGALLLTGDTPTVTVGGSAISITPNVGILRFGVDVGSPETTPTVGSLTLTGGTPSLVNTSSPSITPSAGSLTLSGNTPIQGTVVRPAVAVLKIMQWAEISWAANTEPDLAGYKVYHGTSPATYTESVDVGNVTTYVWNGLPYGNNYFAITSYDTSANESGYSDEVTTAISGGGWQPTINQYGPTIVPESGSLTLTEQWSTIDFAVIPSAGGLAVTGESPTLQEGGSVEVTPAVGALNLTGATSLVDVGIIPTVGMVAFTGGTSSLSATDHQTIQPTAGALLLTGRRIDSGTTGYGGWLRHRRRG